MGDSLRHLGATMYTSVSLLHAKLEPALSISALLATDDKLLAPLSPSNRPLAHSTACMGGNLNYTG